MIIILKTNLKISKYIQYIYIYTYKKVISLSDKWGDQGKLPVNYHKELTIMSDTTRK